MNEPSNFRSGFAESNQMVTRAPQANDRLEWASTIAPRGKTWANWAWGNWRGDNNRQIGSERASAAVLVLALHTAVIALIMVSRSGKMEPASPAVMAFDIADARQSAPHRPASRPSHPQAAALLPPVPATLLQVADIAAAPSLPELMVVSDIAADESPAATSGSCDLTEPVQQALRANDQVLRQLPAIPAENRSVANAMVIWNAGWIDPAGTGGEASRMQVRTAVATLRQAIMQTVAVASDDCRNQVQSGPRLIYLPVGGKTMELALGSGRWTWQQLLDGAQPLPAGILAAGDTPTPLRFATNQPTTAAPGQALAMDALLNRLTHQRPGSPPTALPYYP